MNNRIEKDIYLVVSHRCGGVGSYRSGERCRCHRAGNDRQVHTRSYRCIGISGYWRLGWALRSLTTKSMVVEVERVIALKPLVSQQGLHLFRSIIEWR